MCLCGKSTLRQLFDSFGNVLYSPEKALDRWCSVIVRVSGYCSTSVGLLSFCLVKQCVGWGMWCFGGIKGLWERRKEVRSKVRLKDVWKGWEKWSKKKEMESKVQKEDRWHVLIFSCCLVEPSMYRHFGFSSSYWVMKPQLQ